MRKILEFQAVPNLDDVKILIVIGAAVIATCFLFYDLFLGGLFIGISFVLFGFGLAWRRHQFFKAYGSEMVESHLRWRSIQKLTACESGSIRIFRFTPTPIDGKYAIMCTGDWTMHEEKRFTGKSMMDCLVQAEAAMMQDRVNRDRHPEEKTTTQDVAN